MKMVMSKRQLLLAVGLILTSDFRRVQCQDFTYDGPLGPLHWGEQYNTCDGKYQSPINIDPKLVTNVNLPPLEFSGFNTFPASAKMINNGHTAMVTMEFKERAIVSGGPLNGEYEFAQFHFHWGHHDGYGSESLINYRSFPVELHMVFYKATYSSVGNALKFPDGIAVLAGLFEVASVPNQSYEELTLLVNDIIQPDKAVTFLNPPKLGELMTKDTIHYYTYNGSLTTPPCSESVTWIDFATPIPISSDQIASFRRIRDHHGLLLKHNSRPIQPLNGRQVLFNTELIDFETDKDNKYDINDIRYDVVSNPADKSGGQYDKHTGGNSAPILGTTSKMMIVFCISTVCFNLFFKY